MMLVFNCFHMHDGAGTVTSYGLDGPGIESRWGRDFPHLSRSTLGLTQPHVAWAPYLFPGGKAAEGDADHPPPSSAKVKEKNRTLLPVWAFMACSRVSFTFTFICMVAEYCQVVFNNISKGNISQNRSLWIATKQNLWTSLSLFLSAAFTLHIARLDISFPHPLLQVFWQSVLAESGS